MSFRSFAFPCIIHWGVSAPFSPALRSFYRFHRFYRFRVSTSVPWMTTHRHECMVTKLTTQLHFASVTTITHWILKIFVFICTYPGNAHLPLLQPSVHTPPLGSPWPSQQLLRPLSQVLAHSVRHLFLQEFLRISRIPEPSISSPYGSFKEPWHVDATAISNRIEI